MEAIYDNHNFISVCEFIQNHLYFVTVQNINNGGSCEAIIPHTDDIHFFSTDTELVYHNFYGDFGPLSITCLYKFCKKLTNKLATYAGDAFYEKFTNSRFGRKDTAEKLKEKFAKKKIVVYYTSTNNEKRANAAFLISAFAVLYLGYSPRLAYKALQPNKMRYRPFQDASIGLSPYKINLKDCLDALHKASVFGFFNFNDFNLAECSYYENIEHGDLNWVVPQKFIAFPGPVEEKNYYNHHPNFYIEYFLCNNVSDVIRLNQRAYDPKCFTMFGIKHHDLYMQDGADPPDPILKSFMHVAETAAGAIAVHCKAGLGRTGSLIGAYLLKHYRMTAKEAIAWIRICRPGSVVGHQQTWLENHEEQLWYEGNEWRYKEYGRTEIVPFLPYGIYSFSSPKKEYPGLKELLASLTKSSRYRFIVKNRSKKSKTRLQQMIRNLLEKGKRINENKKSQQAMEIPPVEPNESFSSQISQNSIIPPKTSNSKNLQYLKHPPQSKDSLNNTTTDYEYSPLEYRKPQTPRDPFISDYDSLPGFQKTMECFPQNVPNYCSNNNTNNYNNANNNNNNNNINCSNNNLNNNFDGNLQAMYSNPNAFYSNCSESDYSYFTNERKTNTPMVSRRALPNSEMQRIYPNHMSTDRLDRVRHHNLQSKSIDKNWKQNPAGVKYYNNDNYNKKYISRGPETVKPQANEDVCAFDTRVDTISQYSRFNKGYLNKSYLNQPQLCNLIDSDFYDEKKLKSYSYSKSSSPRSPRGILLSPEDLQSWMENFDEKVNDNNQGEKHYGYKRPSITQ